MKPVISLLPATCALLFILGGPADAYVSVVGNTLAHDCFIMAKAGNTSFDAIATCTSALENEPLSPHDRAGTYVNRGTMKFGLKRFSDALVDYNMGISIQPDLADAFVDRAGAYIGLKRFDEAMIDVNHGIDLGPTYPFAGYYNRAVAEHLTGKYKEAYFDYKKTLELEPHFTPAAEQLKDFVVTTIPAGAPPPQGN